MTNETTDAPMMGWQPISTAPRDGTKIDIWYRDGRVTDVYWSSVEEWWCVDGTYGPGEPTPLSIFPAPSHWMPLPSAPRDAGLAEVAR